MLGSISRRKFLVSSSMAALAWPSRHLLADTASSTTQRIRNGILRGESVDGVRIFRGVPFAEPPVQALRFRPPAKVKPWKGERDATRFASAAMQPDAVRIPKSEDCLYLNVWAPEGKGPFPVYVWIHGGGFTGGNSFDSLQDGAKFAREGIVCVTVAYRLGVFGFLDMGPLLGAGYAGSANNAVRDLIAALHWVQENIEAFGGDPSRVTIGGESAGAKLTDMLMGVPSAQPLFHQMISESGGAERIWPRAYAETVSKGFGETWSKQAGGKVSDLLTAPAADIIDVQRSFTKQWPQHFPLRTEIDSTLIPQLPVKTIGEGSTRGKRLLIGTNRDESAFFLGPHPEKEVESANLGNLPLARFNEVFEKYKKIYPQMSIEELRVRAVTAEEYWIPSMRVVDAHVRGGGTAWMYRLDFAETSGRFSGEAYHSLDVWLAWNKPHPEVANSGAEATMAKQMFLAWTAFIKGETPAADGLPTWPEYRSDTRRTMILDTRSRIEQQPQEQELRLWDGVL